MSQIGSSPASFVVSTGDSDNANGSQTDYGDLSGGNVFPSAYLPKIGSRPIFAAQGNHGFTNNLPYLQNFPAPLASQTSVGRNLRETYCCISTLSGQATYASSWYAFNWGDARFYVLEAAWADGQGGYQGDFLAHWNGAVAGCGPCGAELAWLKADLAAHTGTALKFAFFHYPLHADSSSQGIRHLPGRGGRPRGHPGRQPRRRGVQRARPHLRAQPAPDPGQFDGQLCDGWGRRGARQGQWVQRVRCLCHRIRVVVSGTEADL